MTIPVYIQGGQDGHRMVIGKEGEVPVALHNHPYVQETQESYPFSSFFENGGSSDMRVDGSTTSQVFSIQALVDRDVFIKSISVIVADNVIMYYGFVNPCQVNLIIKILNITIP